jgi:glycosyltransferase involved in cell wall biosynthesis
MVSRYCIEKGVDSFIEAMQQISEKLPDARFVFCGFQMDNQNKKLLKKLHEHQIFQKSILLGQRSDMPEIYSLLDVLVLPSLREAQSCCLIEAMSCGIACVATNVGDSRIILGKSGKLVQSNDAKTISEACLSLINQNESEKSKLRKEGREWIVNCFDLKTFVDNYDSVLEL